jgi:hypothetical protein
MSAITNALGGLVSGLSGADYNAGKVGGYYNDAAGKLVDSTGSPAAQTFGAEEQAALKPQFKAQDQALSAKEAAMGITNSGAGKADFSNLQGAQSATLAGTEAPLYSQALGEYGNIEGQGAGAQAGAYNQSLATFYNMLSQYTGGQGNVAQPAPVPSDANPYSGIPTSSASSNPYGTDGGDGMGVFYGAS